MIGTFNIRAYFNRFVAVAAPEVAKTFGIAGVIYDATGQVVTELANDGEINTRDVVTIVGGVTGGVYGGAVVGAACGGPETFTGWACGAGGAYVGGKTGAFAAAITYDLTEFYSSQQAQDNWLYGVGE